MESSHHSALQGCVSSLRSSMHLLDSSISILDAGVSDYPRLSKVLQTTRHFELVGEQDLQNAQNGLMSEIEPEVATMLSRVEIYLDKLQRREQSLIAKAELQEGRLSRPAAAQRTSSAGPEGTKANPAAEREGAGGLSQVEVARLQQMRQKKERLSYAVSRLELQAGQRQRQLRKSMAFQ